MNEDRIREALADYTAPAGDVAQRYEQVEARVRRRRRRTTGLAAVGAALVASSVAWGPNISLGGADGGPPTAATTNVVDEPTVAAPETQPALVVTCKETTELTVNTKTVTANRAGVTVQVINQAPAEWGPVRLAFNGVELSQYPGTRSVPANGVLTVPIPPGPAYLRCEYRSHMALSNDFPNDITVLDPENLWPAAPASSDISCDAKDQFGWLPEITASDPGKSAEQLATALGTTVGDKAAGYPSADERRTLLFLEDKAVAIAVTRRLEDGDWMSSPEGCMSEFREHFEAEAERRAAEIGRRVFPSPEAS